MKVELISYTPNPEELVAKSAKLCYSSVGVNEIADKLTDEEIERFVQYIVNINHESVLEHISFTFAVEGISRITEIQLVRHRHASYSIQSGRYVNRDNPEFVVPPKIESCKPASKRYSDIMTESIKAYNDLFLILMLKQMYFEDEDIENMSKKEMIFHVDNLLQSNKKKYKEFEKECIEDARYAHLQSVCTKLVFTMNARSLLNFLGLRHCKRAQWEIREMSEQILKLIKEIAPNVFKNAGANCISGKCTEGSKSCGQPYKER